MPVLPLINSRCVSCGAKIAPVIVPVHPEWRLLKPQPTDLTSKKGWLE